MRVCSWGTVLAVLLSVSSAPPASRFGRRVARPPNLDRCPPHFASCAGGDVNTRYQSRSSNWARFAADTLWRQFGIRPEPDSIPAQALRPFFAGADVVMLNVEGAIGAGTGEVEVRSAVDELLRGSGSRKARRKRFGVSPTATVAVVGNIANNHSRDAGDAGRDTTVAYLDAAGVYVTGRDTLATAVRLASGDTIGILGFYTDTPPHPTRAGSLGRSSRHVARAVDQYGTVIVTMHLGAEGATAQRTRNAIERFLRIDRGNPVGFADAAFAGGAIASSSGHGPHVLRAAEWRGDRLVLYSARQSVDVRPVQAARAEQSWRGRLRDHRCAGTRSAGGIASDRCSAGRASFRRTSTRRAFTLVDSLSQTGLSKIGRAGRRSQVSSTARQALRSAERLRVASRRPWTQAVGAANRSWRCCR